MVSFAIHDYLPYRRLGPWMRACLMSYDLLVQYITDNQRLWAAGWMTVTGTRNKGG